MSAGICFNCGDALDWEDCPDCGGTGLGHHDCGEDTCCCRDPQPNTRCMSCRGDGGWYEPHEVCRIEQASASKNGGAANG